MATSKTAVRSFFIKVAASVKMSYDGEKPNKEMFMPFCIHCDTELPEEAQFCFSCGRPLSSTSKASDAPKMNVAPEVEVASSEAGTDTETSSASKSSGTFAIVASELSAGKEVEPDEQRLFCTCCEREIAAPSQALSPGRFAGEFMAQRRISCPGCGKIFPKGSYVYASAEAHVASCADTAFLTVATEIPYGEVANLYNQQIVCEHCGRKIAVVRKALAPGRYEGQFVAQRDILCSGCGEILPKGSCQYDSADNRARTLGTNSSGEPEKKKHGCLVGFGIFLAICLVFNFVGGMQNKKAFGEKEGRVPMYISVAAQGDVPDNSSAVITISEGDETRGKITVKNGYRSKIYLEPGEYGMKASGQGAHVIVAGAPSSFEVSSDDEESNQVEILVAVEEEDDKPSTSSSASRGLLYSAVNDYWSDETIFQAYRFVEDWGSSAYPYGFKIEDGLLDPHEETVDADNPSVVHLTSYCKITNAYNATRKAYLEAAVEYDRDAGVLRSVSLAIDGKTLYSR